MLYLAGQPCVCRTVAVGQWPAGDQCEGHIYLAGQPCVCRTVAVGQWACW